MEYKVVSNGVFTVDNFMSDEECEKWIAFSEKMGYEEAKINMGSAQVMNKSIQNNERLIHDSQSMADELWERIQPFTPKETVNGYALGLNERFRFYKYFPGQQFRLH
ncbi:MAG: prolyl 4-hydroxylase [Maribacter sp.]|jgi:prolyl 4-hydroxylase